MIKANRWVAIMLIGALPLVTFAQDADESVPDNLKRIHEAITKEQQELGVRVAPEGESASKYTTMPSQFAGFVWNDPQSLYTAVAVGALELVVYGIAWRRMRLNVAVWKNEIASINKLTDAKFELVRPGQDTPTTTSFRRLYVEWQRAEQGLAKALARLSKEELDVWLQNDRVSSQVRVKALALKAKVVPNAAVVEALEGSEILSIVESATVKHAEVYDAISKAVTQQRVEPIVQAASRRIVPTPRSSLELFENAGKKLSMVPVAEGKALSMGVTPGARAAQIELTLGAIRNVQSSAERSLAGARSWRRRAMLPALLISVPIVSIVISRYYDALAADENRIEKNSAAKEQTFDRYVNTTIPFFHRPLLSMFVAAWKANPRLKHYPCPLTFEESPDVYNPDLDFVAGWAMLTAADLNLVGRPLTYEAQQQSVPSDEYLTLFFEKALIFARKENPSLSRIPQSVWDEEIIPDLVASGGRLFGSLPGEQETAEEKRGAEPSFEFKRAN